MSDEKYPSNSLSDQRRRRGRTTEGALVRQDVKNLKKRAERLAEEKVIRPPVTQRSVKVKKPGFLQKLTRNMISRDTDNIVDYVLWEVLVPAAKSTLQEGLITGIEMLFHGGASTGRRRRKDRSRISYGNYYRDSGRYGRSRRESTERDGHYASGYSNRLDGIYFEFGEDADAVLEEMNNLIEQYEEVSVADYYELAGIANLIEPTDHGWGWDSLADSRITVTRHGYEIKLPRYHRLED